MNILRALSWVNEELGQKKLLRGERGLGKKGRGPVSFSGKRTRQLGKKGKVQVLVYGEKGLGQKGMVQFLLRGERG